MLHIYIRYIQLSREWERVAHEEQKGWGKSRSLCGIVKPDWTIAVGGRGVLTNRLADELVDPGSRHQEI